MQPSSALINLDFEPKAGKILSTPTPPPVFVTFFQPVIPISNKE